MPKDGVITQKCVFARVPVTEEFCRRFTEVVGKNHGGCCNQQCTSEWRMCRECVLLPAMERSKGKINPKTGLCQNHGGEITEDAIVPLKHVSLGQEVLEISPKDVSPLPDQPRKHFDQARLQALADSIKHRGQVMPGLVIETPEGPCKYELRDGERRLRACKMAGVKFRAVLQNSKDEGRNEALLTSAVANFNREGHTPWEEIDLVLRLLEPCPDTGATFTQAQIAESLGYSHPVWVSNRKVVGERLCQSALDYIIDHTDISFATIKEIADLPDHEQLPALCDYSEGKITTNVLRVRAGDYRRATGASRQKKPSEILKQATDKLYVLEEKALEVSRAFNPEQMDGILKEHVAENGESLAVHIDRIVETLNQSARIIRNAK